MNPYDFVPLDIAHPPRRQRPVWHNALAPTRTHTGKLYSGYLHLYIKAETPLFMRDADSPVQDPRYPGEHIRNKAACYIIPGTSIKGLLRSVVETLCNGCLTVFKQPREYTYTVVPSGFFACNDPTQLCIACRLFGMMSKGQHGKAEVFLGKVNAGDAHVYEESLAFYDAIYTAILDAPKPRHQAFYLNPQGQIAGRKFYFHHNSYPRTEDTLKEIRNKPGEYRNQHIEPLDTGTEFYERLDFTNLEADELAALLFAITLQSDMRHKIGYGKPIGLGSIRMQATELYLVDYATRYTAFGSGRGITEYGIDELTDHIDEQMASFDEQVHEAWLGFRSHPSLQRLHAIWKWPPDTTVTYSYPSQRWFKEHSQARIADTAALYPGD